MPKSTDQLPHGEFRKNADRDDKWPDAPGPDAKGPKLPSEAETRDWADMDPEKREKIQRG